MCNQLLPKLSWLSLQGRDLAAIKKEQAIRQINRIRIIIKALANNSIPWQIHYRKIITAAVKIYRSRALTIMSCISRK
jgi:hypothetical protein